MRTQTDPELIFRLPLHKKDGASFVSTDMYGQPVTNVGTLWTPKGRYFDGVDDYLDIGPSARYSFNQQITLSLWSNMAALPPVAYMLINGWNANGDAGWHIQYNGDGHCYFQLYRGSVKSTSIPIPGINSWRNVVATYDNEFLRLYLDGVQAGTPTASEGTFTPPNDLMTIGSYKYRGAGGGNTYFFNGYAGEVLIFSRALTPLEIHHNYLAKKWRYQ